MSFVPGMAAGARTKFVPVPLLGVTIDVFQTSNNTVTYWPTDSEANDFFVLLDAAYNQTTTSYTVPTKVVPTGFTELADNTDFFIFTTNFRMNFRTTASYKLFLGDEPSSFVSMNGAAEKKILLRIRGANRPIRKAHVGTWLSGWGSSAVNQVVDPSIAGGLPSVVIGSVWGYGRSFSAAPVFEAQTLMQHDLGSSNLEKLNHLAGRTIYDADEATTTHSINKNGGRGVVLSGLAWFE